MKPNKQFYTNENRPTALAWWDTLSEVDKELYTAEYAAATGTDVAEEILTGGVIQNIWAVKSNEVGTETDRKIHRMVDYFRQCESIKILQIPMECLSNPMRSKFFNFKVDYKDTDKELGEDIYSVSLFELLYEVFPEGHECYPELKALDQVCRDLCYSYIQITTT